MHTKQEGVNMAQPKESEKVAFDAEHEARMSVEMAVGELCQEFFTGTQVICFSVYGRKHHKGPGRAVFRTVQFRHTCHYGLA